MTKAEEQKRKDRNQLWLVLSTCTAIIAASYRTHARNQYQQYTETAYNPPDNRLDSKYYDHKDFTTSSTAMSQGINEQWNPPNEFLKNGSRFAHNVLDPLTDNLGYQLKINSWWRSPELEAALGVNPGQHSIGQAIDINPYINGNNTAEIIKALLMMQLPFDQLIIEKGTIQSPEHIHLSWVPYGNRYEVLRYDGNNYIRKDHQWLMNNYF